ncbi:MAG: phosphoribosylanthranilate isomerase [Flavobacteriia bacterium]|nr:phosphoribosylanthranilate isomerase [Flavobacteriia bacterium]MBH2024827.1 phosphoribosylanthranilate isomerase [Flavobacteriales bacterium]
MKLKVCGLTKLNEVQELIDLKTDFLGFIFYPKSPRYVLNHLSLSQIYGIKHSGKVGVFVNESVENIAAIAQDAALNFIQLHGDEDENYIDELRSILNSEIKIIKVIRVGSQSIEELQKTINHQRTVNYILFDTDAKAFGGTGKTFDWQILDGLEITKPYFLSGGISLDNFNEIKKIEEHPFALDINSKFETEPGVKDLQKIKQLYEKL